MGKHAQMVMGPAGAGKSTYCSAIVRHCETVKRTVHVVNLDPAAEQFDYPVSIDIRELITLNDVTEELEYGPNGALVYCLEYLCDNITWLTDQLENYTYDYLLFDCPGQIELYTHLPVMKRVAQAIQKEGYNVCAIQLLDSMFITDSARFISGTLMCLSAMIQLELPHINVLSKCDMLSEEKLIEEFLDPDVEDLLNRVNTQTNPHQHRLNRAITHLLTQYSMVSYIPLNVKDEESVESLLMHADYILQYGEDEEPKEPKDEVDITQ